ncbi:membrane protein insertase YidC [Leptospira wolffii]|uniref:membrane protein insertase YidC n=1 Tax=Leptospira wolffii TaxID=409998 RepID=UPI001084822A|nr:membrane protein insertase YidC [Leptospira wolffii]TGK62021.1 membrane protein insertase YidC [Leptospira wolffii]TGK68622.1 membrane protein insertase YidC [Leptospira wolffii]TGK74594.1 membrane protein insertase YidC [Leptospira wolffii]TGL31830.1 membrane protein insertase YidC [Leptospira wolffii]
MDDRQNRLFLALLLTMGIWFLGNYFLNPDMGKPKQPAPVENQTSAPAETKEADKQAALTPAKTAPAVDAKDVRKFTFKTESHIVTLSSLGGRIEKFYIKNYKNIEGTEVDIARADYEQVEVDGQKFDAIELSRGKGFDFNFSHRKEEVANSDWNLVNFKAEEDKENRTLVFTGSKDGIVLKKTFRFFPNENYFKTEISIINTGREKLYFGERDKPAYLRTFGSLGPVPNGRDMNGQEFSKYFRVYRMDGSEKDFVDGGEAWGFWEGIRNFFFGAPGGNESFKDVWSTGEGVDFVGSGSRYFLAVADTLNHPAEGILFDNRKKNETGTILAYSNLSIDAGKEETLEFANYVGIREWDGMLFRDSKLDPFRNPKSVFAGLSTDLNKSFNQGIFTPIRNGIVWFLQQSYKYTIPSYGFGILLFALLFKLVFYPLNQKQAEAMKKMSALSPELKKLNEKYANDPAKKQEKIMELYKKHNMNPLSQLGGCLPMLIQLPIFFALYVAFADTIDLWKSPFLWISDLSEPDFIWTSPAIPFVATTGVSINLLVLLMVGTQFVSMKLTSVQTDPNQKMMMYIMPLVMVFFLWSMPSGLTLYWTVTNVLSIAQQWITNVRKKDGTPVKA